MNIVEHLEAEESNISPSSWWRVNEDNENSTTYKL